MVKFDENNEDEISNEFKRVFDEKSKEIKETITTVIEILEKKLLEIGN